MNAKWVRLESDDGRWLELRVEGSRAVARVGEGEPFAFGFESLGFVQHGLSYQAWGEGGHFAFRWGAAGLTVEFQGRSDRRAASKKLSVDGLQSILEELHCEVSRPSRAALL